MLVARDSVSNNNNNKTTKKEKSSSMKETLRATIMSFCGAKDWIQASRMLGSHSGTKRAPRQLYLNESKH